MIIITLEKLKINTKVDIIIEGSKKIPAWHPMYGKKLCRCGFYYRYLMLYDGRKIMLKIYRFYSRVDKKTFSLLPFFIQRYERHINTVIESVLEQYLKDDIEQDTEDEYFNRESPSEWTCRRWVKKFNAGFNQLQQDFEQFLTNYFPKHFTNRQYQGSATGQLEQLFEKVNEMLENNNNKLYPYGYLSYCLWGQSIQNPYAKCLGT